MKKKIFFYSLMLIFLANISTGQVYQAETVYGRNAKRLTVDSTLRIPKGLSTRTNVFIGDSAGLIALKDTTDGVYYFTGQRWKQLGGGGGSGTLTGSDTVNISYRIDTLSTYFLSHSGSTEYLLSGLGIRVDSSGRVYTINSDTASAVVLSRQRAAATYVPLIRSITTGWGLSGGGDFSIDRTHIVDSFLVSSRDRVTKVVDSLILVISGAYQAKLNGTGYVKMSGTTAAYRSNTQLTSDVNTFTQTLSGAVPQPTTLNGYFLKDDGTWAAAGTGTVTSLTQGYGIINSTNPITTTGTQRIDTFAIATRAWRDKLADSLGTLIGTKISGNQTISFSPTGDVTGSTTGTTTLAPALTIGSNKVIDAMIRQSAGLSVIGRSVNSTGNVADITGTTDQVMRVNAAGTSVGFGAINLASSSAVSGALPVQFGGTGLASTTAYGVIHAGTTSTGAFQNSGTPGASGTYYVSTGPTSLPTWQAFSGLTTDSINFRQLPFPNRSYLSKGAGNSGLGLYGGTSLNPRNIGIGDSALLSITTGTGLIAMGFRAMQAATAFIDGIAIGNNALKAYATGNLNDQQIAIGHNALAAMTSSANVRANVAVGYKALEAANSPAQAGATVAVGSNAGLVMSTGYSNTFVGDNSARAVTTGFSNTVTGSAAMFSGHANSQQNCYYGVNSGRTNSNAAEIGNIGVGNNTLQSTGVVARGSYNIAIGFNAIQNQDLTGSYNVGLGTYIQFPSTSASGQLNIGNVIYGTGLYQSSSVNSSTPTTTGSIGIGLTTPTARLMLPAGTATANTAPFKFTAGTNLTTAEAGAMEYDGTNLFFSPSTIRYTVVTGLAGSATLDFASTGAGAVADLTITVTGAADGDAVSLGVPNAAITATSSYTAWVSAANTVTVRYSPKATEDPASATFKVFVKKN